MADDTSATKQRQSGAPDEPREHVPAVIVCSQEMVAAGRQIGQRLHRVGIGERQKGRCDRGHHGEGDDDGAQQEGDPACEHRQDGPHQRLTRGSRAA